MQGLAKLQKTQKDVDVLVEEAKIKAVEVEKKVAGADAFAEQVSLFACVAALSFTSSAIPAETLKYMFVCTISKAAVAIWLCWRIQICLLWCIQWSCSHATALLNRLYLLQVGVEKTKVNLENEAAQVEAEKCGVIAKDVTELQARCEKDLAAAEPLVAQAEAALDTLNKKDLGKTIHLVRVMIV